MGTATHYADSSAERINQAKRQIAGILRERRGKQAAISSKGLADACGLKATTVRDIIPEVRREYTLPIASCPGGYYVIADHDDFVSHMNRIEDTIETKRQHQSDLARAWYND
jgi:hypothetical protein